MRNKRSGPSLYCCHTKVLTSRVSPSSHIVVACSITCSSNMISRPEAKLVPPQGTQGLDHASVDINSWSMV